MLIKRSKKRVYATINIMLFTVSIIVMIAFVFLIDVLEAKGKNFIKEHLSSLIPPRYQEGMRKLSKKLNNATSETEQKKIMVEAGKISREIKKCRREHLDPEKEIEAKIKGKMLVEAMIKECRDNSATFDQLETMPFTSVGYDYVDNALEVTVEPKNFNDKNIEKYIKKIRSIVGDEIDLSITQQNIPECKPLILNHEQVEKMKEDAKASVK